MKQYEINEETLAIIPKNSTTSIVYELTQSFEVEKNVNKIMEESCLYFGSTLEGRKKGTEKLIGINYKAPIIVEESKEIIFFPTASSRYHDCMWIALKHIKKYYRENEKLIIEFENNEKISLNISYGILDNQILRATRLESALRGRKIAKNRFN